MTPEEFKAKLEAIEGKINAFEGAQVKATDIEALKTQVAAIKTGLTADELKNDPTIKKLDEAINEMNAKLSTMGEGKQKTMTLEAAIKEVLERQEVKDAIKSKRFGNETYELKVATSDVTGTVSVSQIDNEKLFPMLRGLAFVGSIPSTNIGQNKNRVLWVEGAYTSNAGYVAEGAAAATADTATAVEKSRGMAKISAKIKATNEMLEDYSYIASELQTEMQTGGMLFLDGEIFAGDGNDSTAPAHIYGLKTQGTAFDAAKAGRTVTKGVVAPNIGDLVDCMKLQAKVINAASPTKKAGYVPNRVYLNPITASILRTTKDKEDNYVIRVMADGTMWMQGLQVVETTAMGALEILVLDTNAVKLYFKRNPEIKIDQEGTDFSQDMYTIVMFLRAQSVVKGDNKYGIIYCADYTASLTAITYAAS